jgi:hypothetical protein
MDDSSEPSLRKEAHERGPGRGKTPVLRFDLLWSRKSRFVGSAEYNPHVLAYLQSKP